VGIANAVVAGGSSARVLDLTGAEIKDIPAEAVELPIGQSVFSVAYCLYHSKSFVHAAWNSR